MSVRKFSRSMSYSFEFRPYQRRFRQPLRTSHGVWKVREGIILRLRSADNNREGLGEIAPLPWFGSETLKAALEFCHQLGQQIAEADIDSIPVHLPACQFGFESALAELRKSPTPYPLSPIPLCRLLPTGETALEAWQVAWKQGGRTFKWKIGTGSLQDELRMFEQLIKAMPETAKLRLDANGGLSLEAAKAWLRETEKVSMVEFIEQPLARDRFDIMLELDADYSTSLALDESVATVEQLETCYRSGWRGIFVIKAAIAGSPLRLRQFCQQHPIDAVFSSVFETAIGRKAALSLAAELSNPNRAVGFGVDDWFEEDEEWLENLWNY